MISRALVLGSGANIGFSWQWGVLTGLHNSGVDLLDVDLVVGTSAGSSAAMELCHGADPNVLLDFIRNSPPPNRDTDLSGDRFVELVAQALRTHVGASAKEILAAIGALAVDAGATTNDLLQQSVTRYLSAHSWPEQRLVIPAIDAETGELVTFTRDSGVSLVDAMCASCAIPGMWAPYTLGGRRYIDGSTRSSTNADLATGYDRVLVVAPVNGIRGIPGASHDETLAGVPAFLIKPDADAKAAMGNDVFDTSRRPAAADAGVAQAMSLATAIKEFWQA